METYDAECVVTMRFRLHLPAEDWQYATQLARANLDAITPDTIGDLLRTIQTDEDAWGEFSRSIWRIYWGLDRKRRYKERPESLLRAEEREQNQNERK